MKSKHPLRELFETVAIAFILAMLLRTFLIQVFYIPSASMQPTLRIQDRIVVNKLAYRFSNISRFDIIVFKFPGDPPRDFIKRVIGLPGETVSLQEGKLFINGSEVKEFHTMKQDQDNFGPIYVKPGNYFVMGDNRGNSSDSRVWGPLPQGNIIGKAFLRIWPLTHLGLISAHYGKAVLLSDLRA